MHCSSRFAFTAIRFEPFLQEFRSLFATCAVPYGSSKDVPGFVEELSPPGPLRSGIRSTVRNVLRRAPPPVSHGELVELVLFAMCGTDIDEDAPAVQRTERALAKLVGEAMTSPPEPTTVALPRAEFGTSDREAYPADPFVLDDEDFHDSAVANKSGPEVIVWAPPPPLVWVALLCGALLAPCMYLLSRPHATPAAVPQGANALPKHSAVQTPGPANSGTIAATQPLSIASVQPGALQQSNRTKQPHAAIPTDSDIDIIPALEKPSRTYVSRPKTTLLPAARAQNSQTQTPKS